MSKMDNLRAMREARYEQAAARSPKAAAQQTASPAPTTASTSATTKTATRVATPAPPAPNPTTTPTGAAPTAEPEAALCGHRAISGRTCTREAGHAAKSHRYA